MEKSGWLILKEAKNKKNIMKQKIHRYTYFKGYKKLKNRLKMFEEFNLKEESKTEHGEFLDKKEFEDYVKKTFGDFDIEAGPAGIDNYVVNGKKVAYWTEGSDGNEDFGVIMENSEEEEVFEGEERSIADIAAEISADWKPKVHPYAKPYLEAMFSLDKISDSYGADSGASVVGYFLSNAAQWKGEKAKAIKKELNAMLKNYYK